MREPPMLSSPRSLETIMRYLVALSVLLAGCSSGVVGVAGLAPGAAPVAVTAGAAPCAGAVAAPVVAAPPQLVMAQPTGVAFTVGAPEYARAALTIPGGVVVCASQFVAEVGVAFGKALMCAGNALIPQPVPTARYVYAPAAVAAPVRAPCAPAAVAAPMCVGDQCAPPQVAVR